MVLVQVPWLTRVILRSKGTAGDGYGERVRDGTITGEV